MVCKEDGNLQLDSRDWSMYSSLLKDFRNVLRFLRMITLRYSIGFQCNLLHEETTLSPTCFSKKMACFFRFGTILAFQNMAFCRLRDEYWAVNLESFGLDTLSNTETSKLCIILKHGLVIRKFNI